MGDADRCDHRAQIDRQRLAAGDREDRLLLDLLLQAVETRIERDDLIGHGWRLPHQSLDGARRHRFGEAAQLGDAAAQRVEIGVESANDVIRHHGLRIMPSPKNPPPNPLAFGTSFLAHQILGAKILRRQFSGTDSNDQNGWSGTTAAIITRL